MGHATITRLLEGSNDSLEVTMGIYPRLEEGVLEFPMKIPQFGCATNSLATGSHFNERFNEQLGHLESRVSLLFP